VEEILQFAQVREKETGVGTYCFELDLVGTFNFDGPQTTCNYVLRNFGERNYCIASLASEELYCEDPCAVKRSISPINGPKFEAATSYNWCKFDIVRISIAYNRYSKDSSSFCFRTTSTMTTSSTRPSIIPHIHLLCMKEEYTKAFETAAIGLDLPSSVQISHHNNFLSNLDSNVKFDCVVSPANSYALLDGGFDDAISRAFSPADNYYALTRHAQIELYKQYRGFAPPGTCTLIPIPKEYAERSRTGDRWGCRWLALCPTMRVPDNAGWDREVVYECVWSLLCAIDRHNRSAKGSTNSELGESVNVIDSILMTPLATGVGNVSAEKWAQQAVLALKHYICAVENAPQWSSLDWTQVTKLADDVARTHGM
jgi:O-acetyl-ADP-ribose deacetylase (regulator of RNase III)